LETRGGVVVPTPEQIAQRHAQDLARDTQRLRTALADIELKQPSAARAILSSYYRFITTAPSMTVQADAHFPRTVRQHPADPERCTEGEGNKYILLYFHVGNALLALYDSVVPPVAQVLETRIALLEEIAANGLERYLISGDDRRGYCLVRSRKVEHGVPAAK
jgi:hypothetical protein